ncbi:hypothetical protein SH449x_001129 [Pirellulaceae bacterium SH449]
MQALRHQESERHFLPSRIISYRQSVQAEFNEFNYDPVIAACIAKSEGNGFSASTKVRSVHFGRFQYRGNFSGEDSFLPTKLGPEERAYVKRF